MQSNFGSASKQVMGHFQHKTQNKQAFNEKMWGNARCGAKGDQLLIKKLMKMLCVLYQLLVNTAKHSSSSELISEEWPQLDNITLNVILLQIVMKVCSKMNNLNSFFCYVVSLL